ncbi:hypothetical protein T4B_11269 [Trichinella pseudospiralis]|uniref:Uncharacterized protein n=1 Tax=Trichinella pseudospiralis TaxID=6337 RepID=A0A0V1JJE1_TRIPS|nr:hypothetical protein T4A_12806 [Trichinella pseudospiralis]KRZ35096.1 hypothetical protein T4B_11269 [Trichinella pseudospiralis]KRZ44200.1 hypothetical protein T4C_12289 [Trichinella pseudospiralis]
MLISCNFHLSLNFYSAFSAYCAADQYSSTFTVDCSRSATPRSAFPVLTSSARFSFSSLCADLSTSNFCIADVTPSQLSRFPSTIATVLCGQSLDVINPDQISATYGFRAGSDSQFS